jgi:hypothetical protein
MDPSAAGTPSGSVPQKAVESPSTINRGRGFGTIRTKGSDYSTKISSSIKQSLLDIVQKCEMYGREDIYRKRFGLSV